MRTMEKRSFRTIFLYEFKLGTNAAETANKINTAFGQGSVTDRTIRRWFEKFRKGDETLEEQEGRGRKNSLDNAVLKAMVERDPHVTVRELAEELSVGVATISRHLNDIGKTKKMDKWVPHELTESNRTRRYEISSALLLRNTNDPFLDRIVTCDEKWLLYDNRKRSAQWLDRDEPPKQFPKPNAHPKKTMVIVWWTSAGSVHYHFLKPGETVTSEKYCDEVDIMNEKLRKLQPALVNRRGPILLHDNARPHVAHLTIRKLNQLGYETLSHPPYSPDLSPTDYHFFKYLDHFVKDKHFHDQTSAENAFKDFIASRTLDFYSTGINKLVSRWQKCVEADGAYFD